MLLLLIRLLLATFALVGVVVGLSARAAQAGQGPNIVFIVADDLGYADVGFHGGREIATPNIDSIAASGIQFRNGYVSGPYCSPTRAGLLTGRYQQRFGHEFNPPGVAPTNGVPAGLDLREKTLADRLRAAGYRTAVIGKWHLGATESYSPLNRGFDEFFGFPGAAHSYTNPGVATPNPVRRGNTPVDEKEYLTSAFTREAVSFIQRQAGQPFFLYLAYNAVHSPLEIPPGTDERFSQIADPKRRAFAGLLTALDDGVGQVLGALKARGLEENTLVVFFSDNGGPTGDNGSRNTPLRGYKFQTWEGGIHIPFAIRWKSHLPAGRVYDAPVIQLDLHATALAAAGVALKPEWQLDGVDLVPFITGQRNGVPHEALFWRFGRQYAIRQGDWKLVLGGTNAAPQLFNLANDLGELNDRSGSEPARVRELQAAWDQWNQTLVAPTWPPRVDPAFAAEAGLLRRPNTASATP